MADATEPASTESHPDEAALTQKARTLLLWERLWPRLALPLSVLALFMAASWFGLFEMLPGRGRLALLLIFVVGFGAACLPLLRLGSPAEPGILSRLDQ